MTIKSFEYTRERQVFDKPLLDQQAIHFRLAGLQAEVEALRALTYDAVEDYISGVEVTLKASMAKLKGGAFGS